MEIYESNGGSIGADGKIALTINGIEALVIINPDEEKFSSLIERLKGLLEQFPENVIRHIDEIRDVVEYTIRYYKEKQVKTPDISFLYRHNYGK